MCKHQCKCSCHTPEGAGDMHFMACCEKCPTCHEMISDPWKHDEECHNFNGHEE
jgi:hypothetical protein